MQLRVVRVRTQSLGTLDSGRGALQGVGQFEMFAASVAERTRQAHTTIDTARAEGNRDGGEWEESSAKHHKLGSRRTTCDPFHTDSAARRNRSGRALPRKALPPL